MKTRDEILAVLRNERPHLVECYGVQSLALFGSVARGEATPASDVDLLFEFQRRVGLFDLFALQDELGALLGCPVDVGTARSLKPRIRDQILDEAIYVS